MPKAGLPPDSSLRAGMKEIAATTRAFARSPRALWGVNLPYLIEGVGYFGVLTLLMKYLSENLALGDIRAGVVVSLFTGGITFAMFFLGEMGDRYGLRRVVLLAIAAMAAGRTLLAVAGRLPGSGLTSPAFAVTVASLGLVVIGFGLLQPALFSAAKQLSDPRTSALAFAVLYGLNNLGAFLAGAISPSVRRAAVETFPPNGISGVFALYAVLTVVSLLLTARLLSARAVESAGIRTGSAASTGPAEDRTSPRLFSRRWFAEHPLRDLRFAFFVFILMPVQTLFAHTWLTLPLYINRAFVPWVAERFELFANLSPLLVFLLAPLVAALTARRDALAMIRWGTLIMALPAFLLVLGPSPAALFAYIVLMTIGESMWQPRFFDYITRMAPPGKAGAYVGIGQLPWFLTKLVTGFYAGWFLHHFCPAEGPRNTEDMWLIYAAIAMVTPTALFLTRRWLARPATTPSPHVPTGG